MSIKNERQDVSFLKLPKQSTVDQGPEQEVRHTSRCQNQRPDVSRAQGRAPSEDATRSRIPS